ncbi:MAG: hypothetical protein H6565_17225 [Lewinellaceae bacterium]|nr:hypothetical protein [Lewinellaceae bacterium]
MTTCLLLIFLITPCAGQNETNAARDSTAGPDKAPAKESRSYIDPLFYIKGQLCQHLRKIYQDKSGNLWFGTNVYGLMRYDGDTLVYFSKKDGLGGGRITGIVEDKDGNVWFGTYGGLTQYDGTAFTNFSVTVGPFNNDVWSIAIDRHGMFWVGTMEGVFRFDGEIFTPFPIPKAIVSDTTTILSYDRITRIIEDKNGVLWFGTDGFGICKYDPSAIQKGGPSFSHFTKKDGLCDNNIYDLMEDAAGNIWIGTMYGGLSMYDGCSFTNFTENGVISGVEVGGFYEDKTGNIWFAAENHGVYRYDGASFTNFNTTDGLNTNGVLCIFEDRQGRFWLGGWGGLFRFDRTSFFSVTKDGPWAE